MDFRLVDPEETWVSRFSLLLRTLFRASDDVGNVFESRMPGLGVALLLYQFRAMVHVTARHDDAVRRFLRFAMRPEGLAALLQHAFEIPSFSVFSAASNVLGPSGQPGDFPVADFMEQLNPYNLPHGCAVEGLVLNEELFFRPLVVRGVCNFSRHEARWLARGISRAVRDRRLPSACQLIFERVGRAHRRSSARLNSPNTVDPPAHLGSLVLNWEDGGGYLDQPTTNFLSVLRPAMFWVSSRPTRYCNRTHRARTTTPRFDSEDDIDRNL